MLARIIDNVATALADWLAPARCHACLGAGAAPLCAGCLAALPWNERACRRCALPLAGPDAAATALCGDCLAVAPPQDATWAAFTYRPPVSRQIVELKFHGRLAPAHVLGAAMAARLALRPQPLPELLVPVPLHAGRLRRRGYNQALEVARQIARRLEIPLVPEAARRLRSTGEQTRLDAAGRRRNVRGAFAVAATVRGRHVALLDDVITTGATVAELARAARAAGARRVEVWAVARVAQGRAVAGARPAT
jgi:ComF family protein